MTKKYTVYHSENGQHPRRLTLRRLTQPLIACSVGSYTDGQVVQYAADRAGRGWVRRLNVRQGGGAVCAQSDIQNIYSLVMNEEWPLFHFLTYCLM